MIRTALVAIAFIVFMLVMDHIGTSYNDAARVVGGAILVVVGIALIAYLSWLDKDYRR